MFTLNAKHVLALLILVMLVCAIVSWFQWNLPNRSKISPRARNGNLSLHQLYILNGTKVSISSGDMFTPLPNEPLSAILIGAKADLSKPHVVTSLDYQFRERLRKHPDNTRLVTELDGAARAAPPLDASKNTAWIAPLSPSTATAGRKPYMLAGIDVDIWGDQRPKDAFARKSKIIEAGVEMALVRAASDGIKRFYLPMLGAGAGALGPRESIQAVLSGVNAAAYYKSAPSEVVVQFFAPSNPTQATNDQLSQLAFIAHEVINDCSSSGPWKTQSKYLLASQIFLLVSGVLASALMATLLLNSIILTPTTIITHVVKWVVVSTGVLALGQSSWYTLNPLESCRFLILLIAAFIIPFWEWGKLGEPENRMEKVL